jgi:flagellar biosynthesis protein FlhF
MANRFFKIRYKHLSEVANKVQELFGPQAIIIGTQEVREKGIRGWFGQKTYEVTVSVPEQGLSEERKKSIAEKKYLENSATVNTEDESKKKKIEEFERIIREAQQRLKQRSIPEPEDTLPQKAMVSGAATETPVVPFPKEKVRESRSREEINNTLREIRELLQVMAVETVPQGIPPEIVSFYKDLVQQGMSKRLSADLIHTVLQNMTPEHASDPRIFIERLALELRKRITTTNGIPVCSGVPRWIAFCGPTGVGKPHRWQKIAAHYAVHEKVRVALASTDTYRVGAAEQLKIMHKSLESRSKL